MTDYEKLSKCILFSGLSEAEIGNTLDFFEAENQVFAKGEQVQAFGRPVVHFGLLLSGAVQVCRDEADGTRLIMAQVAVGDTFGESLCYIRTQESPVYIIAVENSEVLWMRTSRICNPDYADAFSMMISGRFVEMLANRTLAMNNRIQILSQITLRQKLITLFDGYIDMTGSKTFSLPFNREDMAVFLGTDRSSLSRELGRMKKEGKIDFYKNTFKIF